MLYLKYDFKLKMLPIYDRRSCGHTVHKNNFAILKLKPHHMHVDHILILVRMTCQMMILQQRLQHTIQMYQRPTWKYLSMKCPFCLTLCFQKLLYCNVIFIHLQHLLNIHKDTSVAFLFITS